MYILVDKDDNVVEDELEHEGILYCKTEDSACGCIIWLLEDSIRNAYRGLRIEKVDLDIKETNV